jgi:hypothetical protein
MSQYWLMFVNLIVYEIKIVNDRIFLFQCHATSVGLDSLLINDLPVAEVVSHCMVTLKQQRAKMS